MNALNSSDEMTFAQARQADLLGDGVDALRLFARSLERLKETLRVLMTHSDETAQRRCTRLLRQIDEFEPAVTLIGQIKSGKTSLVNALIGAPDLLPADVNPWTSVVTSLHLKAARPGFEGSATFRFFERDEWDRLISGGGRIGELASRAGADAELEKIKRQVSEMREKSRVRLGRKFEVLLGQQHDYGYFDRDLIERYVCLGEDFDETDDGIPDMQGRFADITKSADIEMARASLPIPLCLRDTPGVNDTFMMREQVTIRAIRESRTCVVVLSASQALSSADMALIRLISNVKSREVIIFVNRIDELSDPVKQVPQIRDSIKDTLQRHKGPKDADIVFGSALWASYAFQGEWRAMPAPSLAALRTWIKDSAPAQTSELDAAQIWQASGLPALQQAVSDRIIQGAGAALLQRVGASAKNVASGILAADLISAEGAENRDQTDLSAEDARALMVRISQRAVADLSDEFDGLTAAFSERIDRVQDNFLDRAAASLVAHLERFGETEPWNYDPAGLRVLLGSSHKVLARNCTAAFDTAARAAAKDISVVYARAFSLGADDISISLPRAPHVPSPVTIGRTIALDLKASWWKKWWLKKRGYKGYAASFFDLIKSETNPLVSELRDDLAQSVRKEAIATLEAFLSEQLSVFDSLKDMHLASPNELRDHVAKTAPQERRTALKSTMNTLNEFAAV